MSSVAEQFVAALGKLEESRNVDEITSLFAADSEIGNIVVPEKFQGPEGAREFWSKYRDTFEEMHSTYRSQISSETGASLEWITEGTSKDHHPVRYEGVSILEFENGQIKRFRAYFNPAALAHQIEPAAGKAAAAQR
jgi:ketosteroid isomerase-like protein